MSRILVIITLSLVLSAPCAQAATVNLSCPMPYPESFREKARAYLCFQWSRARTVWLTCGEAKKLTDTAVDADIFIMSRKCNGDGHCLEQVGQDRLKAQKVNKEAYRQCRNFIPGLD